MTLPSKVTGNGSPRNRRSGYTILLVLMLCLAPALIVAAETVTMDFSFERPKIEPVYLGGDNFDRVIMPGAPNAGKAGEPALPAMGTKLLLPYGTEVENIQIIPGTKVFLGSGYEIEPNALPIRLSETSVVPTAPTPNEEIYRSDNPFPANRFVDMGTHSFRGYSILILRLQPVEYIPATGELYYYTDFTVHVTTTTSAKTSSLFRGLPEDEQEVMAKVDNPDMAYSYLSAGKLGAKAYDLLIITTPTLASAFQPLKDYHDTTGIMTTIQTTDVIGSTDPDDIRAYITTEYTNSGISYVIIGADDDIIPAQDLYVKTGEGWGHYTEENMPGDVFFGCLDGTYNYDGDSYHGETTDGDGGGDVDLVAEVFVGRCAAGNTAEVDRFVNKTIGYLTVSGVYLQKVLMVGEYLGFGGPADYAAETLDENIDGSDAHGYTTVGIPSSIFTVDRLYERDWAGNDWPQSELVTRINDGVHILNHLGHGSEDYAMKLYNSDVLSLVDNSDLCLVYSQTCLAGHLDGTDCWAEHMNIKIDEGAFAVLMNARYGFGESNSTDGPSQRFNREFWDAVFNTSEGKPELGRANHDSKEDNLYRIGDDCMRWCYYEINLFGDPTVSVRGVTGISFEFPTGLPEIIPPNVPQTFEVVVSPTGDGVPVPGTGQLHYTIDDGPVQTETMVEIGSNHYEATLPAVGCQENLKYYVSAEEASNGRFYNPNPSKPNEVVVASAVVTAFTDDFETDLGWTISGGTWGRGTPTGGGGEYGNPDPTSGHDGSANVYGYNLNGDYENSMPEQHLTSPAIDCSEIANAHLKFWRWLGVEQPSYDHAYVRISTDGSTWNTIWENGGTIEDSQWSQMDIDISDYVDGQPTAYIRFTMGTSDGSWRYCGWNIDDLEISGYVCYENRPYISTSEVPDWTVGQPLSLQMEAFGGTGDHTWTDKNNDLAGTGLTLSSEGLLSGTPTAIGEITFTAQVVDEAMETDDKGFTFTINETVAIATVDLPEWTAGISYSQQLSCTGGTEPLIWSDKNAELDGTGLTLSEDGLLSGTPVAGAVSFTALVTDHAGVADEEVCSCTINPAVTITTETLPEWTSGHDFLMMLTCDGGTGELEWEDKHSNLMGTGLVLRDDGQFWGIPDTTGTLIFTAAAHDALNSSDEKELSITINPAISILTSSLPSWTVNQAYSRPLSASGGTGELEWSVKDNGLDGTGLSVSTDGHVVGTPTVDGSLVFTVVATDETGADSEKQLSLTINPAVAVDNLLLGNWTAGHAYSHQMTCTGGTGSKAWSDKNSDLDGTGLTLSSAGLLTGTPDEGEVSFIAVATDQTGSSDEKSFGFTVNPAVAIQTETLPGASTGEPYSQQLAVTGGTGTKTWTDKNGDLDGTGLTISATGEISGTPTVTEAITFTAKAADQIGAFDEQVLTIDINAPLAIDTENLPDWTAEVAYSQQLQAIGGVGEYTWTDKNGDLDGTGLTLSASGLLAGTPTVTGLLEFTAMVTDQAKASVEQAYEITVNAAVGIIDESLPNGVVDEPYSVQLNAYGGTGTRSWTDKNSDLAAYGMALSTAGLLTGTVSEEITVSFTALVADQVGSSDEQAFSFAFGPAYVCGDANDDEDVNLLDVLYLIDYLYGEPQGPAPNPIEAGDANGDSNLNLLDVLYLVDYLYGVPQGPDPICQ